MMKRATTILMLVTAAFAFAGVAAAQSSNGSGNDTSASQQKTQQLMQQYRETAMKLQKIHQKTIKNDPQLSAEQNHFQDQVRASVKKHGYDVQKGQKDMQDMAQKLQSGKLSKSERQATMQKFQAERQKMMKARDAALKEPAIQKSGHKLEKDTIAAMKKQDNNTPELLKQLRSLRGQIRASMPKHPQASGSNNG